jgi:uncharacterized protein
MPDDEETPRPGHFLPGGAGAGDDAPSPERRPPAQPSLGQPRPLEPGNRFGSQPPSQFGGRPPAWQRQAPAQPQRRRFSAPVIAGLVAAALVVAGGVVFAASRVVSTFEGLAKDPLAARSTAPPQEEPSSEPAPDPTVTVTATPPTDSQILRQNKLYAAAKLTATCKEPPYRPASKAEIQKYVQAMVGCLNTTWSPVLRKAGHEFRAPRFVLSAGTGTTDCGLDANVAHYCTGDELMSLPWQMFRKTYRSSESAGRVEVLSSVAVLYSFHVQELAGILEASSNLEEAASTKAAENELDRRFQLQADCLAAVFVAAVRASYPVRGRLLEQWNYQMDHTNSKEPATEGSRKSIARWQKQGFRNGRPGACNTWVAPAATVS